MICLVMGRFGGFGDTISTTSPDKFTLPTSSCSQQILLFSKSFQMVTFPSSSSSLASSSFSILIVSHCQSIFHRSSSSVTVILVIARSSSLTVGEFTTLTTRKFSAVSVKSQIISVLGSHTLLLLIARIGSDSFRSNVPQTVPSR